MAKVSAEGGDDNSFPIFGKDNYYEYISVSQDWADAYFEFESIGKNGSIRKGVAFQKIIETPHLFYLLYGDAVADIKLDTKSITDNGDQKKLLATISVLVHLFLTQNQGCKVKLRGENGARTRLYRMFININYRVLSTRFAFEGGKDADEENEVLEKDTLKQYDYFLVQERK